MEKKLTPGVYIHLPFCSVQCIYCDFPLTTRLSLSERYYCALLKELKQNPPDRAASTLYFGGGTPSLAPAVVLRELIASAQLRAPEEITLEVNPDHVTIEKLAEWHSLGINRLSLGIQSLEPAVLQGMLRQHSAEQALDALLAAREAGFQNLNVDLMLGFPEQTVSGFLSGLQRLTEFHPDHFSIYLLEVHERTGLHRLIQSGKVASMPEEEQLECFDTAVEMLASAEYEHYEVSNFARKGKTSFHNLKYWSDAPYHAYGAGACSYLGSVRTRNQPDVAKYIELIETGQSPVAETIQEDEETTARNALIFGMRKVNGIDMSAFENMYRRTPQSLFGPALDEYLSGGFLEITQNHLRLTRKGMLLSNEILSSVV
ncbi:radical SAM family heme chaperone HemW [bacterium]|nr:radical SAM family heme chaperone HemW [bacterium]MCI0605988.1 radical SAM family heme chaperone HemW [bacterium]